MTVIKIDYTCVHTDNYQGGSGHVANQTLYKKFPDDTMIQMIKGFALNSILNQPIVNGYPIESFHITSIEIIDIVE